MGKRVAERVADRIKTGPPGRFSPSLAWLFRRLLGPLIDVALRPRFEGWEQLPTDRPALLVANHSGGGVAEIGCLMWYWLQRGPQAPAATGMAHPLVFWVPGLGQVIQAAGAIPSTYRHAESALRAGTHVLVFPGGDHEAWRPIWQANRVDFNGRKGFLRLARAAWVPIIPIGIHGSHYTMPILLRSRLLAWVCVFPRLLGVKRIALTALGAVGAAWIVALLGPRIGYLWAVPLALLWITLPGSLFLPWVPWPVRVKMGAPIPPEVLFGAAGEDGPLDDAYERVVSEVQRLVVAPKAPLAP